MCGNPNCPSKPVAILSISNDFTSTQLSRKPNINNFTNLINVSDSCCLYEDSQRDILFCNDLQPLVNVLNEFNLTSKGQLAFYLGNEGDTNELLFNEIIEKLTLFKLIYIYGYGDVVVTNINKNVYKSLFYFVDIIKIEIQNVTFKNGGFDFFNCLNVQLIGVHILNSTLGGCIINILDPNIANTLQNISYNFLSCSFIQNGNATMYGGGLLISLKEDYKPIIVRLENCLFDQNVAFSGGAVSIALRDLPVTDVCQNLVPVFAINNCSFTNNRATDHGGAMYIETYSKALYGLEMYRSDFINNSAINSGGGFYSTIMNYDAICDTSSSLVFDDCKWENNSAKVSAVIGLHNTQPFRSNVTIVENKITNNHASSFSFGGETYCIMYCNGMNVTLNESMFLYNDGSALCIRNSELIVQKMVSFGFNSAYQGGGVFLDDNAWISLAEDSYLVFTANSAIYGGGLYQRSMPSNTEICFLNKTVNSSIRFIANLAHTSGGDIYFQSPSMECKTELSNVSFAYDSKVSSSVQSIQIQNETFDILLGQTLVIAANVTDFFGNPTSTFVSIFLLEKNKSIFEYVPYNFSGFTSFSIINGTNSPDVYITGPNNKTEKGDYSIVISTLEQSTDQIKVELPLTVSNCVLGFTYNSITRACDCASSDLQCDFNAGTACVEKGYWFGHLGNNEGISAPCSSGKCKNIAESCIVCPSKGLTTFCLLPKNESVECIGNWAGALCTECQPGYSYTFQAQNCVKSSTCTNAFALVPTVLIIAYLLIVISVIFIILKLGNHVKSGYIYCIIYYFSIVKLLLPENVVSSPLVIIVSVFQSFLQLDPYFLGYIPVCISPNITILQQKILTFLNPLIISIVILSIISLSKYCSRIQFKDNSVVKAMSMLALLSFTTLTETSFDIIIPIKYNSLDTSYVKIQPSTKYFDLKEHLLWWIIAVLVMGVFVIPFTCLLLFAPFLVRCINLTKIKPFLDEFQSCYKDKFRWMAGYYFLCRIILFLSLTGSIAERVEFQYTAMILSIFILIFHMLLQPYQDKWLNVIDSILLADLVFVAILYNISSVIVFDEIRGGENLRQFLTYLLVIVPMIYVMIITALVVLKKLPTSFKQKSKVFYQIKTSAKFVRRKNAQLFAVNRFSHSLSENPLIPTTEVCLSNTYSEYREPLIDSDNYNDNCTIQNNVSSRKNYSNASSSNSSED